MFSKDDDTRRSRAAMKSHKQRESMFNRTLHSFNSWLKRKEEEAPSGIWFSQNQGSKSEKQEKREERGIRSSSRSLNKRPGRQVVPGLPRPITFRRQNSEKRDRLLPHEPDKEEKRATSLDRRAVSTRRRTLSPPPVPLARYSTSELPDTTSFQADESPGGASTRQSADLIGLYAPREADRNIANGRASEPIISTVPPSPALPVPEIVEPEPSTGPDERMIQRELESRWILNLSMHFRDMSDREKFFITFAETPTRWRRVTVSIDYRNKPHDSLEADIKSLHYQRDKSSRIYESIRDSLGDIQFYPTVTNLKLETEDGQLHVHVTEDVNEIIPYPSATVLGHLDTRRFQESSVQFESHISGFVYKVVYEGKTYIKKEIPGPDAVDEFLYEINALSSIQASSNVIKFEGIMVNDNNMIKGLLISFAEQGALVDVLYDWKQTAELPWKRRERWAKQIVQGLSEIHEAAYVQGDFTLSNIVIDANDDAKIIDINRRGCPVGWEPPELAKIIQSGQRIGMYIGVKSDLFQLGMVLWALAQENDEPERADRPLRVTADVPEYYKNIVSSCLSADPRDRKMARALLKEFPEIGLEHARPLRGSKQSLLARKNNTAYIDPATAVDREDIERMRQQGNTTRSGVSTGDGRGSTEYHFDANSSSAASYVLSGMRGPSPVPYNTTELTVYSQSEASIDDNADRDRDRDRDRAEPPRPSGDYRASFRNHVMQHRRSYDNLNMLAFLEREVGRDDTPQVSRQNTLDFCAPPPLHQDSGFSEGLIAAIEAAADQERDGSTPRRTSRERGHERGGAASRAVEQTRSLLREDYAPA